MSDFDKNLERIGSEAAKRGEEKVKGNIRTGSDAETAKSAADDFDAANNIDDTLKRRGKK